MRGVVDAQSIVLNLTIDDESFSLDQVLSQPLNFKQPQDKLPEKKDGKNRPLTVKLEFDYSVIE